MADINTARLEQELDAYAERIGLAFRNRIRWHLAEARENNQIARELEDAWDGDWMDPDLLLGLGILNVDEASRLGELLDELYG